MLYKYSENKCFCSDNNDKEPGFKWTPDGSLKNQMTPNWFTLRNTAKNHS